LGLFGKRVEKEAPKLDEAIEVAKESLTN